MQSLAMSTVGERPAAGWLTGGLLVVAWLLLLPPAIAEEASPATRRSHIQPVGEMVPSRRRDDIPQPFGLQLSRAPEIVRRQLALARGEGLVVDAVINGSLAAQQGFLPHDVLVKLNDQLLVLPEQFSLLLEASLTSRADQPKAETSLAVTVLRAGKPLTIHLGEQVVAEEESQALAAAAPAHAALPPLPPAVRSVPPSLSATLRQPASAVYLAGGKSLVEQNREAAELLREDPDFTIRLIQGEEMTLLVDTPQGQRVFHAQIDSPARLAAVPPVVRPRVEAMLQVLKTAAASRSTTIR